MGMVSIPNAVNIESLDDLSRYSEKRLRASDRKRNRLASIACGERRAWG